MYEGRFDEDDFEGAYRELDRRYYSGEGAAFAEAGATATDWVIGFNRSDFDWIFGELTSPEVRFENRSRSVFPDRSAAQFRESVEALDAMVASSRTWHAVVSWLSPVWVVVRQHREAVGRDGERYEWLTLHVSEVRGGRLQSICQFEIDDEEAAFAYAEERVRATASRLAITNRASQATDALGGASRAADVDGTVGCYANTFVFDDRRRLTGDPSAARPSCGQPANASSTSTANSIGALWLCAAHACTSPVAAGPTTQGTKRAIYTCAKSAMTDGSPTTPVSTRTTSTPPTVSSSDATTPAKARRSPKPAP